uniref:C2 domain-containing protein n=1 Tax=Panagrolaimus superbus TaxID=310955 RepID=A0A914Y6C0_9BILA
MDLSSLQADLYGNLDDDPELLAELEALSGETKPKQKPKPPPAQKQLTPAMLNQALKDEDDMDFDDDDLENDEDLQNELAGMMGDVELAPPPPARPVLSPQKRTAESPPPPPARGIPPVVNESKPVGPPPPLPARSSSSMQPPTSALVPAQPPPSSTPSDSSNLTEAEKVRRILQKRFEAYTRNLLAAKEANDLPNAKEFAAKVEMFEQALAAAEETDFTLADLAEVPDTPKAYQRKKIRPAATNLLEELELRYDKLIELAEDYKNKGEDSRARMQIRLSGQYKDAINAHKRGRPVDIKSLPLVPGLSKLEDSPFASAAGGGTNTSAPALPISSVASKPGSSAIPASIKPKPAHPVAPIHPKPEQITGDTAERNQLRLLLTRQQQFKEAALAAKKSGNLQKAKEMLLISKKLEPMIQACEGGLPVDIRNIPVPPQTGVSTGLMRQFSEGADHSLQEVEKALLAQVSLCDQHRTTFNERNDSRSVLIYEKLMNETKMDLLHFRQMLESGHQPSYKVVEVTLPSLNVTTEKGIADDQMEVKIINIEKLKVAEGYKSHHLAIYLKYNFHFPHESHQTGKSQTISNSDNPEFNEIVNFKINRKVRQLMRTVRRVPLKFEVYQKGSFLRSDKLWGTAEVSLAALEKQPLITLSVDILEGRRKTGGKLTVQVRVSRPITEADTGATNTIRQQAPTVIRKWVRVNR